MPEASLATHGYAIHRAVVPKAELAPLREEAERLAKQSGKSCVRYLCSRSARYAEFASDSLWNQFLPANMRLVRSLLFNKTATENWPLVWHQDLTIEVKQRREVPGYGPWVEKQQAIQVQPPLSLLEQMVTIRVHLDDAGEDNGALWVLPESHLQGKQELGELAADFEQKAVCCAAQAGDVLLMKPLLFHSSKKSKQPSQRRIVHFEFAPEQVLDEQLEWEESA